MSNLLPLTKDTYEKDEQALQEAREKYGDNGELIAKIKEILERLEDAISYEDWNGVEDSRKELMFLLEELQSDFPSYEDF